jgi:hypothetical protein
MTIVLPSKRDKSVNASDHIIAHLAAPRQPVAAGVSSRDRATAIR